MTEYDRLPDGDYAVNVSDCSIFLMYIFALYVVLLDIV